MNKGLEMTHQQNKSIESYVPCFWDWVLCMCDLFMEINKDKKDLHFHNVGAETVLGSI